MAVKFINENNNTREKKHFKYYNFILMILFAGVVALVLFFANKKEKRFSGKEKAGIDNNLTETINIRLDELENK